MCFIRAKNKRFYLRIDFFKFFFLLSDDTGSDDDDDDDDDNDEMNESVGGGGKLYLRVNNKRIKNLFCNMSGKFSKGFVIKFFFFFF